MVEIFTQTLLFKLPRVKLLPIIVTNATETMIMPPNCRITFNLYSFAYFHKYISQIMRFTHAKGLYFPPQESIRNKPEPQNFKSNEFGPFSLLQ